MPEVKDKLASSEASGMVKVKKHTCKNADGANVAKRSVRLGSYI